MVLPETYFCDKKSELTAETSWQTRLTRVIAFYLMSSILRNTADIENGSSLIHDL